MKNKYNRDILYCMLFQILAIIVMILALINRNALLCCGGFIIYLLAELNISLQKILHELQKPAIASKKAIGDGYVIIKGE